MEGYLICINYRGEIILGNLGTAIFYNFKPYILMISI